MKVAPANSKALDNEFNGGSFDSPRPGRIGEEAPMISSLAVDSEDVNKKPGKQPQQKNQFQKLKKAMPSYVASADGRDFAIYILFTIVFSFISFASKPGVVQFYVTDYAKATYANSGDDVLPNFDETDDSGKFFEWMSQTFLPAAYPQTDYTDQPLGKVERLSILGSGRIVGAIRLRQLRTRTKECEVPDWLQKVYGEQQTCARPYSRSSRQELPFWNETLFLDPDADMNFTRPFEYQGTRALNTTSWYIQRGAFDSYGQSGYVLDFVPNVAATRLAQLVQECRPWLENATQMCAASQGVPWQPEDSTPVTWALLSLAGYSSRGLLVEAPQTNSTLTEALSIQVAMSGFELDNTLGLPANVSLAVVLRNIGAGDVAWEWSDATRAAVASNHSWIAWGNNATAWGGSLPSRGQQRLVLELVDEEIARRVGAAIDGQGVPEWGTLSLTLRTSTPLVMRVRPSASPTSAPVLLSIEVVVDFTVVVRPGSRRRLASMGAWDAAGYTGMEGGTGDGDQLGGGHGHLVPRLDVVGSVREGSGKRGWRRSLLAGNDTLPGNVTAGNSTSGNVTGGSAAGGSTGGASCREAVPFVIPPGLSPKACFNVTSCPLLPYLSYEQLARYSTMDYCGLCRCAPDPDAECSRRCNALTLASEQLDILKTHEWVDGNTRALVLDLTVFYPDYNLFTVIRLMWEAPPFGGLWPYDAVRTVRLYRYVTASDRVVLGFEVVFLVLIAYYTLEELWAIFKQGLFTYLSDGWNWLDWANLIIFYVVIGLRVAAQKKLSDFDFSPDDVFYIDFPPIAYYATQELNVSALNFFLIYFKFFKFLRKVPRMDAILVTVSSAAVDLLLFTAMAVIVLFGFAAAFYVCFGPEVEDYKSLGDSWGALMRALLGDFDYKALSKANRFMAPFLFYLFFLTVFFILLNMFLAIINDR
eukprot:jgi/Mesvir1/3922/Mv19863-RA.2